MSQDNSIGIATGYRLGGRCSIPVKGKICFSTPQRPDPNPASYEIGTGGFFPREKAGGA
jgi:hypothetical protein